MNHSKWRNFKMYHLRWRKLLVKLIPNPDHRPLFQEKINQLMLLSEDQLLKISMMILNIKIPRTRKTIKAIIMLMTKTSIINRRSHMLLKSTRTLEKYHLILRSSRKNKSNWMKRNKKNWLRLISQKVPDKWVRMKE